MENSQKQQPLIIIGAGPASLTASIYASRYGIKHQIVGEIVGGQISETHLVDNYPGIEDVTGFDLAQKMAQHAKKYGVEILPGRVQVVEKKADGFQVKLENGQRLDARTILIATGTKKRKLGLPSEAEFQGKGVSYCATCDGFFYKGKTVAVVGGSDSALGAAVYLAKICAQVFLIYRQANLRAEKYWQELLEKQKNIQVIYETNVTEIKGQNKMEEIILDRAFAGKNNLAIEGLFVEVGAEPEVSFLDSLAIEKDESGYIKVNKSGATSLAGVWAAGDITDGSDKFRQIITAAAEGAIAARGIFQYLKNK